MTRCNILLALAALTACAPNYATHICSSRTNADEFVMATKTWRGFEYTDHNDIKQVIGEATSALWECRPVAPVPELQPMEVTQ